MSQITKKVAPAVIVDPNQIEIEVGQWYWVAPPSSKSEPTQSVEELDELGEGEPGESGEGTWLGCVTNLGSNYVLLKGVHGNGTRIHINDIETRLTREPNTAPIFQREIQEGQKAVRLLMEEVIRITNRLGVGEPKALGGDTSGTSTLAKIDPNLNLEGYKKDLIIAREKTLPELFKKIQEANTHIGTWMQADLIPLEAQAESMKEAKEKISDRIFHVELYAGLLENIHQVSDGKPADTHEKIRVFQRRLYMDEECLANYQVGGMSFKDIKAFDRWVAKPENRDRLLPFPRCMVAFQVRRHDKPFVGSDLISLFQHIEEVRVDKLTFLYLRNGERLYRIKTGMEFDERLFPDPEHNFSFTGKKLYQDTFDHDLVTEAQYEGLIEEYEAKKLRYEQRDKAHKKWKRAKAAATKAGQPFDQKEPPYDLHFWERDPRTSYRLLDNQNVYFDDGLKKLGAEIKEANRIAVVLQGLLDRSEVFHPHPKWQIWTHGPEAVELIYDDSRTFTGGEKPDFEAYRKRLNASLKTGSITVGQEAEWEANHRKYVSYGHHSRSPRDLDDPGPGLLAKVIKYEPQTRHCNFAWSRPARNANKELRSLLRCSQNVLLNVDAYQPGDFRIFFSDPRTRADYIQWAPLLLEAEEYHAGNRKVLEPPSPEPKTSSREGQRAYQKRKLLKSFLGKAVRLTDDLTTTKGDTYEAGSLWRVSDRIDRGLTIHQINPDGTRVPNGVYIRRVQPYDLEKADNIPDER